MPSGYCFAHDPHRAADRTASATLGGLKAGAKRRKGLDPDRLGDLQTPVDAKRMTAAVALAVATGELSSAQGRTVLVAIQAWLKAHEQDQIDELERRLQEQG